MENQVERIEEKKQRLVSKSSWVHLKGKKRKQYKKLCQLQRATMSGKEGVNSVLDKR